MFGVIIRGAGWAWEAAEQCAIRRGGSRGGWLSGVSLLAVGAAGGGRVLGDGLCHVILGICACKLAIV